MMLKLIIINWLLINYWENKRVKTSIFTYIHSVDSQDYTSIVVRNDQTPSQTTNGMT